MRNISITQSTLNTISWSAIFSGVFVALSISTILNFLGMGLNFIVYSPAQEAIEMGFFSFVWVILTSIASMFVGGWIAGRMSGCAQSLEGAIHGLAVCGMSIFITFLLLIFAGGVTGIMSTVIAQNYINEITPEKNKYSLVDESKQNAIAREKDSSSNYNENINQPHQQDAVDNQMNNNSEMKQKIEKQSKGAGSIALILFVSFLLSTLSAGVGGARGAASLRVSE